MTDDALLPDPTARLVAAFRRVHAEKMQGLPIVNPALAVEAVGFSPWQGAWLGVMVTPWSINLLLLPRDSRAWRTLGRGEKRRYEFPAGEFVFIGAYDETIGEYQACSLFSPALEFADHETARLTAQCARAALVDEAYAPEPGDEEPALRAVRSERGHAVSKRNFLRGRFGGASGDD
jgi:[NiFe] hydrogenase assembly HybE family chaperone